MAAKKQPRRKKHIPQRTCVVCRVKSDKRQLMRIVRTPDQGVVADPTGKRNGRGAYVCMEAVCWKKLRQTNVLDQALRTRVTPEEKEALAALKPS